MTFTADSYWNTAIPGTVTRDTESDDFISWIAGHSTKNYLALSTDAWSMPVYRSKASDPLRTINPTGTGPTVSVRIPTNAVPMTGNDAACLILDTTTDQGVGRFEYDPPSSASGVDRYYLSSEGIEERAGGTTGNRGHRGIPGPQSCIRSDHLSTTYIRTRLKIAIPGTAPWHVFPMINDEGDKGGVIGEGMILRIKPGVDVAARGLTGDAYKVAQGIKRYGVLVGDNGAQPTLKQERGLGLPTDALSALSWSDYEWVERGWRP